jgi:hypothetical protein
MFTLKSRSAAHAFIDIVRCTRGNPHLVDVIEANAPYVQSSRLALERHVQRALEAADVVAAACHEEPRKGMQVAIDVRDRFIQAALLAMLDLYTQFAELGDTAGYCADAVDVAEIRMTIQAVLDLPEAAPRHQGVGEAAREVDCPS